MRRTVQFLIPEHSSPLSHQKEQWSRWVEGAVVNQSMITPQSSICARVQGCGSSSQSRIDEPSENWFQKTSESDYETVKTKSGSSSGEFETRMYEIEKKNVHRFFCVGLPSLRAASSVRKKYTALFIRRNLRVPRCKTVRISARRCSIWSASSPPLERDGLFRPHHEAAPQRPHRSKNAYMSASAGSNVHL